VRAIARLRSRLAGSRDKYSPCRGARGGACDEGLIGGRGRVDRGWMQPTPRLSRRPRARVRLLGPSPRHPQPREGRRRAARHRDASPPPVCASDEEIVLCRVREVVDRQVSAAPREDYGVIVTSDMRDASFSEPRAAPRGCRADERWSLGKRL